MRSRLAIALLSIAALGTLAPSDLEACEACEWLAGEGYICLWWPVAYDECVAMGSWCADIGSGCSIITSLAPDGLPTSATDATLTPEFDQSSRSARPEGRTGWTLKRPCDGVIVARELSRSEIALERERSRTVVI